MRRFLAVYAPAALFITTGVLHLLRPEPFMEIMPAWLPAPAALVFWSGIAEVAGGWGLLFTPTRKAAASGLLLLLLAVFPANVQMAVNWYREVHILYPLALLRLPLQAVLMAWVYRSMRYR